MTDDLRNLIYLLAAAMFIFGLKGLTHPRSAVRGNMLGALGMLLAAVVTVLGRDFSATGWGLIVAGVVLGAAVGAVLAIRIQMTAMPQMVALLNGFGGIASVLVSGAVLHELILISAPAIEMESVTVRFISTQENLAMIAAGLIGAVTFTGSIVAFGKLQEIPQFEKLIFPRQKLVNLALAVIALLLVVAMVINSGDPRLFWLLVFFSLALGALLVSPIGGADMPVVISLLNSYSGIAAAATGFVISNTVLIVAGALVGASGLILTQIMCKAMNRSLANVLFGGMGTTAAPTTAKKGEVDPIYATVKSADADEIAMLFDGARRVLIVPGYGLAVSQAQHAVRDLASVLEARGIEVAYAIHPVAGRMPGHMNVLLAEADVPYEQLLEMEQANSQIEQTDVAIVIGANDTVNPIARSDPSSPITGMPIVNVDKARTVVVIKRSLSPGFAGIANPLFAAPNTLMMFGDGKKAVLDLIAALKAN